MALIYFNKALPPFLGKGFCCTWGGVWCLRYDMGFCMLVVLSGVGMGVLFCVVVSCSALWCGLGLFFSSPCSRHRFFLLKWCVAARITSSVPDPCPRHVLFCQKRCIAAWLLVSEPFFSSRHTIFPPKWCNAASHLPFSPSPCSRYRAFLLKGCVVARTTSSVPNPCS